MSTKAQLQNSLDLAKNMASEYYEKWLQERNRADSLQTALDAQFPELQHAPTNAYPATRSAIWFKNQPIRDAVSDAFRAIVDWCGRNEGYGDDLEEKEATGLGGLVYIRAHIEPSWAIRFAAEVCEQHNYHGECAQLMGLYDAVTQPYSHSRHEAQSVNWWAD
jgi:hypothetical protein